jgi:hypothetical protein
MRRTSWGCTTCTAMSGSGVKTCTIRKLRARGLRTVCTGAAAGATLPAFAARRTATGPRRAAGAAASAFGLPEFPSKASKQERSLAHRPSVEPRQWLAAALDGSRKAKRYIVDHCVQDVLVLEKVIGALKAYSGMHNTHGSGF